MPIRAPLLDALTARLVRPTLYVLRDQEDDRIAYARATALAGHRMTRTEASEWLTPVRRLLADGQPGPVPPHVSNTLHTMRTLHVLLGQTLTVDGIETVVPHAPAVRRHIGATLRAVTPWMWAADAEDAGDLTGSSAES